MAEMTEQQKTDARAVPGRTNPDGSPQTNFDMEPREVGATPGDTGNPGTDNNRRNEGILQTEFDMETGINKNDSAVGQGVGNSRGASFNQDGMLNQSDLTPGGAISGPATGTYGSGPVNIGPGTGGGTKSPNTTGDADIMGQTSAQDWGNYQQPGSVSGTRDNSERESMRREDVLPGGLRAEAAGPSQWSNEEENNRSIETAQRDLDTERGVGNRETYMEDEENQSYAMDSTDARNRR